jgi:hypothetical protein
VVAALAAARELPQLSLADALELTLLVARKDPRRHPRVAARWLLRYLEEDPEVTIEEAALAASCLIAIPGARQRGRPRLLARCATVVGCARNKVRAAPSQRGPGS